CEDPLLAADRVAGGCAHDSAPEAGVAFAGASPIALSPCGRVPLIHQSPIARARKAIGLWVATVCAFRQWRSRAFEVEVADAPTVRKRSWAAPRASSGTVICACSTAIAS